MKKKLSIQGMSCQHCVGRVKKYLEAIETVSEVHVDLENKEAVFRTDAKMDMETAIKAINAFGFTAKEIS